MLAAAAVTRVSRALLNKTGLVFYGLEIEFTQEVHVVTVVAGACWVKKMAAMYIFIYSRNKDKVF